jgi:hypothetical protein
MAIDSFIEESHSSVESSDQDGWNREAVDGGHASSSQFAGSDGLSLCAPAGKGKKTRRNP